MDVNSVNSGWIIQFPCLVDNWKTEKIFYAQILPIECRVWWKLWFLSRILSACVGGLYPLDIFGYVNSRMKWVYKWNRFPGRGIFGDIHIPYGFTKLLGVSWSWAAQPQSYRTGNILRGLRFHIWIYKSLAKEKQTKGKCTRCVGLIHILLCPK